MNFSNLENFMSMFSDGKGQIDGKAIKTAYVGVNGVAKKMKKGYIGAINPVYRNLPVGYTQVEYIESSGTQCVDLGINGNSDLKIVLDFMSLETAKYCIAGYYNSESDTMRFFNANSEAYLDWGNANGNRIHGGSIPVNTRMKVEIGNLYVKNEKNQEYLAQGIEASPFTQTTNIFLCGNSNYSKNRFWSIEAYQTGELIGDFVPCINDVSGEAGMYDMVNHEFHGNAGTGTFAVGAEVTNAPVACLFFNGAINPAAMAITYSGNHTDEIVTMGDGKQYRLLTLTSTGTLTLEEEVQADVWVCNGGGAGSDYGVSSGSSGSGGSGGSFCNALAVTLPKSSTITVASAGGASNVSDITLSNWLAGSGGGTGAVKVGRGGTVGVGGAKAGGDTRPFADSYYTQYPCAGGGGGCTLTDVNAYGGGAGGSSIGAGASGGNTYTVNASGGVTGGGRGACSGSSATAGSYYGSGGGGGSGFYNYTLGKSGYQGLCVIRIPLEQSA